MENKNPLVTMLLPNYNNEPVLDMFFNKLAENTDYPNYEFIVIDDGSTDGGLEIVRKWQKSGRIKNMRVLENQHCGVPKSLNDGLKLAKGDYICRFDGDITVETPGWLQRMMSFIRTDQTIGMIVAKIIFDTDMLPNVGRSVICPEGLHNRGWIVLDKKGRRTLGGPITKPKSMSQFDSISEIDTAFGCCTLFPRDLANEIGGFDEHYTPVWTEDDDFGLSVRKHNKKVFYFPEVTVFHHVTLRVPRTMTRRTLLYTIKNSSFTALSKLLPLALKRPIKKLTGNRIWEGPARYDILMRHYKYWEEKWGFDPLNPDMDKIKLRWSDSEIWWNFDNSKKRHGEEIVSKYFALKSNAADHQE